MVLRWLGRLYLVLVVALLFAGGAGSKSGRDQSQPVHVEELFREDFRGDEPQGLGLGANESSTDQPWSIYAVGNSSLDGYFRVVKYSGREMLEIKNFGNSALGVWVTNAIDTHCFYNLTASLRVFSSAANLQTDFFIVGYTANTNGSLPEPGDRPSDIETPVSGQGTVNPSPTQLTFTLPNRTSVQLVVQATAASSATASFAFDDVKLTGIHLPSGQWSSFTCSDWSDWSDWMPSTCGVNQTRSRQQNCSRTCAAQSDCDLERPLSCPGNATKIIREEASRTAEDNCCGMVNGSWSSWYIESSYWSDWAPLECGVEQTRKAINLFARDCDDPPPSCGGRACQGQSRFSATSSSQEEKRGADVNCCAVDGGWTGWATSAWSTWAPFVPTECGFSQHRTRYRNRTRACMEPEPECGGDECIGSATDVDRQAEARTAEENCCAINGGWSEWSVGFWSGWSEFQPKQCNTTQQRSRWRQKDRTCTNPAPACGGTSCAGSYVSIDNQMEKKSAEENCCVVDGGFSDWITGVWASWSTFQPSGCGHSQSRQRNRIDVRECNSPFPACGGSDCDPTSSTRFITEAEDRNASTNCCPVNGGLSDWIEGDWSEWSSFQPPSCGEAQSRQRNRTVFKLCTSPAPSCGGALCDPLSVNRTETQNETRSALDNCCPVDGGFGEWVEGVWSSWSAFLPEQCGITRTRFRHRNVTRACDSPVPTCRGRLCEGISKEVESENQTRYFGDQVHGGWTDPVPVTSWSSWSSFEPADTCNGTQTRWAFRTVSRSCTNPSPQCNGLQCDGLAVYNETRNESRVVSGPIDAGWSDWIALTQWSAWSSLSPVGCDVEQRANRTRHEVRTCSNPPRACGGATCVGNATRTATDVLVVTREESCTPECVVNGNWTAWEEGQWSEWQPSLNTSLCDVQQEQHREKQANRNCSNPYPQCGGLECLGESQVHDTEYRLVSLRRDHNYSAWSQVYTYNLSAFNETVDSIVLDDIETFAALQLDCPIVNTHVRVELWQRNCTAREFMCDQGTCTNTSYATVLWRFSNATTMRLPNTTRYLSPISGQDSITSSCCTGLGSWSIAEEHAWSMWTYDWDGDLNDACGLNVTRSRQREVQLQCDSAFNDECGNTACEGPPIRVEWVHEDALIRPTDGGWSDFVWDEWTPWQPVPSAPCNTTQVLTRTQRGTRTCTMPTPLCGGAQCPGNSTTYREASDVSEKPERCDEEGCIVEGNWSAWYTTEALSDWTSWEPSKCGVPQHRSRTMSQLRTCTNPLPRCGGNECQGNATQSFAEVQHRNASINCCAIDGAWSEWVPSSWQEWSVWSPASCNSTQRRSRSRALHRECASPPAQCGGATCVGDDDWLAAQDQVKPLGSNCCPDSFSYNGACIRSTICTAVEREIVGATATSDRVCSPCDAGSVLFAGICTACPSGTYVPQGQAGKCSSFTCESGTTDHDSNAATPCVECLSSCSPGSYLSKPCTATSNRVCTTCTKGTFSIDGKACHPCSNPCPEGTFAQESCNLIHDYTCALCSSETTCQFGVESACNSVSDVVCKADPSASSGSDSGLAWWVYFLIAMALLLVICNTFLVGRYCCTNSRQAALHARDIELMSVGQSMRRLHRLNSFEEPSHMYHHGHDPHNRHIYEHVGTLAPVKSEDGRYAIAGYDSGVSHAGSSGDYRRSIAVRNSSMRSSKNRTLRRKPRDRYASRDLADTTSEADIEGSSQSSMDVYGLRDMTESSWQATDTMRSVVDRAMTMTGQHATEKVQAPPLPRRSTGHRDRLAQVLRDSERSEDEVDEPFYSVFSGQALATTVTPEAAKLFNLPRSRVHVAGRMSGSDTEGDVDVDLGLESTGQSNASGHPGDARKSLHTLSQQAVPFYGSLLSPSSSSPFGSLDESSRPRERSIDSTHSIASPVLLTTTPDWIQQFVSHHAATPPLEQDEDQPQLDSSQDLDQGESGHKSGDEDEQDHEAHEYRAQGDVDVIDDDSCDSEVGVDVDVDVEADAQVTSFDMLAGIGSDQLSHLDELFANASDADECEVFDLDTEQQSQDVDAMK
eukprot:m.87691 g.87691  ORF g.87691 m.87691 type:complete len:2043 (+) comp12838_c5_seq1:84-6212(+)